MEVFLVHERTFSDAGYLQLAIGVERETWLRLFTLCDKNWGNTCVGKLSDLAAKLWPEAVEALCEGDMTGADILREAVRGIERGVELGLLIAEETHDGLSVGFKGWEDGTGKDRQNRGCPTYAMGPKLAATRRWDKLSHDSMKRTLRWAERYDLVSLLTDSSKQTEYTHRVSKNSFATRGRNQGPEPRAITKGRGPEPRAKGRVQEVSAEHQAEPPTAPAPEMDEPNVNGRHPRLTKKAADTLAYVGADMTSALSATEPLQDIADSHCGGDRLVLALAYADEARARGQPRSYSWKIRDGDLPGDDHVRRAKTGVKYDT
jgi:hypothetical protein